MSILSNEGEIIETVPTKATPIHMKRKGDTRSLIKNPENKAMKSGEVHCNTTAVVRGINGIA